MLTLDQVHTVAFAGLILFLGYGIRRVIPILARYNIPAPVVGGLLVATTITIMRARGVTLFTFNTGLQTPLMIAFFTTIGFGASLALLRVGGPAVLVFFLLSTAMAVAQNAIGAGVALALGQPPLLGVLAGSVTLTGGPATGLAFAPLFEAAGIQGAATLAVAAAMVGIVSGGIVGAPLGTWLIGRTRTERATPPARGRVPVASNIAEDQMAEPPLRAPEGEDVEAYGLLKAVVLILVSMWIGSWLTVWFASVGITLPAYIGAMLVAAAFRNLDDATKVIGISQRTIDDLGGTALSLFLVMALMTLRLWDLVGLAVPLVIMLAAQVDRHRSGRGWARLPGDGRGLRGRGHVRRLRRLHARDDGQRDGQHGSAGSAIRPGAEGLPRRADGRRILHRLHQRAHHYTVLESLAVI